MSPLLDKLLFPWRILWRTILRFDKDHGAFLASGLAFNMVLCVLPFLLILASLSGYFLESSQKAQNDILTFFQRALPGATARIQTSISRFLENRELIGAVGLVSLVFFASRLFGSIRVVLNLTFNQEHDLNIITGKLFDIGMVVLTTMLLVLSIFLSSVVGLLQKLGESWLFTRGYDIFVIKGWLGDGIAFVLSTAMFFVMYRMPLPSRVPTWIVALQAFIVGALWEFAKWLFGLYLTNLGRFDVFYGSFGVLVALVLWIDYSAIIFVIGAELGATIFDLRKKR